MSDEKILANNVVAQRKSLGWSQRQLAEEMQKRGHSAWRQTTVSRVEHGLQPLSLSEVSALTALLGGVLAGTSLARHAGLGETGGWAETLRRLTAVEHALEAALAEVQAIRETHAPR